MAPTQAATVTMHDEAQDAGALFAKHGLRKTRQRVRVFSALAMAKTHPTAEELHRLVCAMGDDGDLCGNSCGNHGSASLATVYNTLDALCRAGLARRLPSAGGEDAPSGARFEACMHEHVHLMTPDGRVHDVPDDLGKRILGCVSGEALRAIERRLGVKIARVDVSLVTEGDASVDC